MENRNSRGIGTSRGFRAGALALVLAGICLPARAETPCPWINATTASGLLGAPATATYTGSAPFQPGTCTFVANIEGGSRSLIVNVEVASDAQMREHVLLSQCSATPVRLNAIGNEASLCEVAGKHGARSELVVGHVRDQVFFITIVNANKSNAAFDSEALRAVAYTAAEQVSGNLF